jgi:hypothetical protein
MSEEDRETTKYQKFKKHLKENKKVYLVGAGCLTAGYFLRPQVVNVVDVFNLKYKSPTTTEITNIILSKRACPEPIPVRDKLTGEAYASIRRAAKVTGMHVVNIAKDVKGAQTRFERLPDYVLV